MEVVQSKRQQQRFFSLHEGFQTQNFFIWWSCESVVVRYNARERRNPFFTRTALSLFLLLYIIFYKCEHTRSIDRSLFVMKLLEINELAPLLTVSGCVLGYGSTHSGSTAAVIAASATTKCCTGYYPHPLKDVSPAGVFVFSFSGRGSRVD